MNGNIDELKRAYRQRGSAYMIAGYALLVAAVMVGGALTIPSTRISTTGRIVEIAVAAVIALFGVLRLGRAGAYADREGIRILNPFRSIRVPWKDIQGFSLRPHGLWAEVGHADLRDGRSIHILGIQPPNRLFRPRDRSAQVIIEELNERLRYEQNRLDRTRDD
jgi:hypothetical protein